MKKVVLMVEDDKGLQRLWVRMLKGIVEVVPALSIDDARREFAAHPDLAAIVIGACVPGVAINTEPLVRELRATFRGPMIATSGTPLFYDQLVTAGCSHRCEGGLVPEMIRQVLGLPD